MLKKRFIVAIAMILTFALCGGKSIAQDSVSHLEFKGIPLNGKIDNFVNKLKAQGFSVSKQLGDIVVMEGTFTGKDATVYIISSEKSHPVWKVLVKLPKRTSWSSIKSDYEYYKEMFTKKYGNPTDNYEFFSKPYYEGDGYEMSALRNEKCHYISAYENPAGVIYIEMSTTEQLSINYEDKVNSNIREQEKEASVIDDI